MFFNYKMDGSKTIDKNIDKFTKMVLMLKGIDQALGEMNETMILLNSLPTEYQVIKNALQYTIIVPEFELVVVGIKVRELELNAQKWFGNDNNLFAKEKQIRKKGLKAMKGLKEKDKKCRLKSGNIIIVGRKAT